MSVYNTFFGLVVVLLLSFVQVSALQSPSDPGIDWYESFFQEKTQPAEKDLEQRSSLLEEARAAGDLPVQAKLFKEIGLIQLTRFHDYEVAMDFFIQSLVIEDSLKLTAEQIFTYTAMARVFEEIGDNYKSREFLEKAITINEPLNNQQVLVFLLNKLGKINASLGRLEEAFENYSHVLKYEEALDQPRIKAEALFNLGLLYSLQTKYEQALDYHKRALAIRRNIRDKRGEARSLNDIGELYRSMKNMEKALANHVVALEIRQTLDDKKGIAESFNNIASIYFQQKNYDRAVANLNQAVVAGNESQAQHQISKSYELLNLCYKETGDFKKALEFKELSLAMNEFIQNEKNVQQVQETQSRFEIQKKEAQVEKLESIRKEREREIQSQKKFRNFLFALIGLGVIIALLIFYLYLMKRRSTSILQVANRKVQEQNLQLQELNATKDKFFSIISHDLKGPLNSLTSFSGLLINHLDSLSKEEIQMLAKDLDKSVKNLFALLENLLEWSRSQTGNIEFKPETFSISRILEDNKSLLHAQAQHKNINIQYAAEQDVLVQAHKNSVTTVVRNLISNAIKFTPPGGTITLNAISRDNEVVVSIADNGVGMSQEIIAKLFRIDTKYTTKGTAEEKGTGLGLILCKEFIEKNGGRIWVESEPGRGSVFYFTLPLSTVNVTADVVAAG
jgi:signal transduction histidine kinase